MSTKELLDTLSRYGTKLKVYHNCRKILKTGLKKISEIQNISENDLRKAKKLQTQSIDELREIAILRGFKKLDDLTKEDLRT